MKKGILLLLVSVLLSTAGFSQLFAGKTRLDTLAAGTISTATVIVRLADQFVLDYSVNVWDGGKLKLKNPEGKDVKLASLSALLNLLQQTGFQVDHITSTPFSTITDRTINETNTTFLCYTVIFKRK